MKLIRSLLLLISCTVLVSGCCMMCGPKHAVDVDKQGPQLEKLNWNPETYAALDNMIRKYGVDSPDYNPLRKPYAVFDWDNTSVINDIGESLFLYQLQNLEFKMSPYKFAEVVSKDVPKDNFSKDFYNKDSKPVNIGLIAQDINSDYEYLYENYSGFKGDKSLSEIKDTLQYKDFVVKSRFLYEAIGGTFSPDVSYPWVTYFLTGMTEKEVFDLTKKSIKYWEARPMQKEKFTSPEDLPGKAGVVSISCYTGLRTPPEMQNLYKTLMKNGFDVYVCSASFKDIIKYFSSNPKYGYGIPPWNIMAMELERDKHGVIVDQYRLYYDQTQNKGKTKNINRFLVSKYGYGPTLVAGDSGGDVAMLSDYKDLKVGLIVNRCKSGEIGDLCKLAVKTSGQPDQKYFLQGRDENKGIFIPQPESILYGTDKPKLLK